jgi:hypothetical protein
MIEPPFTFFEKRIEVGFRYAVVTAHMPLCLAPDNLDPVDVVFLFGKFFAMIDPNRVTRRAAKQNSDTSTGWQGVLHRWLSVRV